MKLSQMQTKPGKLHISYTSTHQTFGQQSVYQGDRYIPVRSQDIEYCFDAEDTPFSGKPQEIRPEPDTDMEDDEA